MMNNNNVEIAIDGYAVYIEGLESEDDTSLTLDAGGGSKNHLKWTSSDIENAMKPLLSIMNSIKTAASCFSLDEIELTTQIDMALKGELPILKIISAETATQMSVKLKWKNNNN